MQKLINKSNIKWIVLFISLWCIGFNVKAQIEPVYSLYTFNPQVVNPAHAGSTEKNEVMLIHRQQWIGLEGAPKSFFLNANLHVKEKSGVGLNGFFDQAGPVSIQAFSGDYSYHTQLNENWTMSSGVRMGMANVSVDFSGLRLVHSGDESFATNLSTGLKFNTGWGLSFSNQKGSFLSVSMPRIIKYNFGENSGAYKDVAYIYAMIGSQFTLSQNFQISPSILVRAAADAPLSVDFNLMSKIGSRLDLGVHVRLQDSMGARLGVQISEGIYLGYVYEMPTNELSLLSNQTHELGIKFNLKRKSQANVDLP